MDKYNGIPGINLNHLNITDSISSGLSILGNAGPLTNATAVSVNIPNYNLNNIAGEHAWWAKCFNGCPVGGLTVSNSVVPEYQNDSGSFSSDSQDLQFTYKTSIDFKNDGSGYTIDWVNPSAFQKGTYTVLLYADGYTMGKTSFMLK